MFLITLQNCRTLVSMQSDAQEGMHVFYCAVVKVINDEDES